MPGLNARVAARGFPVSATAGETGVGALESQGGPVNPDHGETLSNPTPSTITGYDTADTVAGQPYTLLEGMWGLTGTLVDPDQTPQTHAAPVPGWAGSYAPSEDLNDMHINSAQIHSEDFGALVRHTHVQGVTGAEPQWDQWTANTPGETPLQKLDGQIRAMGGRDDVQGYGLRNNYGFDAGHIERHVDTIPQPMSYLDPGERVFVIPQASGSFTPNDAVQGPGEWSSGWDGGSISYTDPSAYTPATEPALLQTPQQGAPASAGWFA